MQTPKKYQLCLRDARLGTFDHQTSDARAGQAEIYYGRAELRHGNTSIKPILKKVSKIFLSEIMLKQFFWNSLGHDGSIGILSAKIC